MKFLSLLKKEIRELLSLQSILGLFMGVLIFVLVGSVMGNIGESLEKASQSVIVSDLDQTAQSQASIDMLTANNMTVTKIDIADPVALADYISANNHTTALIIPKGFEESIISQKPAEIQSFAILKSFSMFSNMDESAENAADIIKAELSTQIFNAAVPNADPSFLKDPVAVTELTSVKGNTAQVNSVMLMNIAMQQSIFIPIIVFILITFATQLNVSAIANEKMDKTLETLLSAPVSRLAVLSSKMVASAIYSLLMAGVYMVGFSFYMGSMTGAMTGGDSANASGQILAQLGLNLSPVQFLLIGVQLFLTISIALVISLILGSLAKDLKSAQGLITPLMFMTMIPYFITMFMDINSLPTVLKFIVYAIPFTHTFTASPNLIFGNYGLFFFGMLYQAVFLAGVLFLAVRVFSTDKIFTLTLDFTKKKKGKVSNED